jgi:hypothetical protein
MPLRFLGIILIVLRLDVSVYNVYMTNPFQTTFVQEAGGGWGWGVKSIVEVTVNSKEEIRLQLHPRIRPLVRHEIMYSDFPNIYISGITEYL